MSIIIADKINHLTAARYFAARGASWLFFDPAETSVQQINAIRAWIEGPYFGLYLPLGVDGQTAHLLESVEPSGVMVGHFGEPVSALEGMTIFKEWQLEPNKEALGALEAGIEAWPAETGHVLRTEEWSDDDFTALLPYLHQLGEGIPLFLHLPLQGEAWKQLLQDDHFEGFVLRSPREEQVGILDFEEIDEVIDAWED